MKNVLLTILGLFYISLSAFSQEASKNDSLPPLEMQRQMFIYGLATKYNDPQVAKLALYNILSQTPGNTTVMDSLAVLYFQYQDYVPAALISQDILRLNPKDMLAAEIGAFSFENLGVPNKAIPLYEKLYLNNNDINVLYQIAFLQYTAKRYEESLVNIETLLSDPESEKRQLVFPMKDGRQQQVQMKAGVYRLKGMLESERGNLDLANQAYDKALEISPIFDSVKELKASLK